MRFTPGATANEDQGFSSTASPHDSGPATRGTGFGSDELVTAVLASCGPHQCTPTSWSASRCLGFAKSSPPIVQNDSISSADHIFPVVRSLRP